MHVSIFKLCDLGNEILAGFFPERWILSKAVLMTALKCNPLESYKVKLHRTQKSPHNNY